jgi:hypothetical protein
MRLGSSAAAGWVCLAVHETVPVQFLHVAVIMRVASVNENAQSFAKHFAHGRILLFCFAIGLTL